VLCRRRKGMRAIAPTALAALAGASCSLLPPPEKVLVVAPPFAEARVFQNRLYARLIAGTPLGAVVGLEIAPVRAGMTLDEARKTVGEPLAQRSTDYGTYYLLRNDGSALELAHITGPSSGGRLDKWVVVAAPKDNAVSSVLSKELQALILAAGEVGEVTLHEHKRPQLTAFSARVKSGNLYDLQWYSIEGIPGG